MRFLIYYMKPEFFRDGNMGYDWLSKQSMVPDPNHLEQTHTYLRMIKADDLDHVYRSMQGESWSPNGEARRIISILGLKHTSMSVGDIAVNQDGAWMVDRVGFQFLGKPSHFAEMKS